jgi:hypothetical protein
VVSQPFVRSLPRSYRTALVSWRAKRPGGLSAAAAQRPLPSCRPRRAAARARVRPPTGTRHRRVEEQLAFVQRPLRMWARGRRDSRGWRQPQARVESGGRGRRSEMSVAVETPASVAGVFGTTSGGGRRAPLFRAG